MQGRCFEQGESLSNDLGELVVSGLKTTRANTHTRMIPRGQLVKVANDLYIHSSTIKRVWENIFSDGSVDARCRGGRKPRKLSEEDVIFIEAM